MTPMEEKMNPGMAAMEKTSEDSPPPATETTTENNSNNNNKGPNVVTTADRGVVQEPDVEYGVYEPNEDGLAVAVAVTEEDEDVFIPSAVEYDPDAKPPLHRNRRFRLYVFLAFFAFMTCAVGATIGIVLGGGNDPEIEVHEREKLGIRDLVTRLVGEEQLTRYNSPYKKATDWMIYDDAWQLTPDDERFVQRFIMAYFYFATSEDGPWKSCNPPNATLAHTDQCSFEELVNIRPLLHTPEQSTRWLSNTDECEWAGVSCDRAMQVRSISLGDQEMSGSFPAGIVHLPLLQAIKVPVNKWRGLLPEEVASMKHLVNLELHANEFTGTIPEIIWNMKNLVRLNLASNRFTGTLSTHLNRLRDIKGLFLYANQLTGTIPTEITQLQSLTYFRVSNNQLTGPIPSEFGNLHALEEFWISSNDFSGELPPGFGEMPNLRDIRMRKNLLLTGRFPDSFWGLPEVDYLDIRDTNLTGSIGKDIGNMNRLGNLRVSSTRFDGTVPTELGRLANLGSLWIQDTDMTGAIPAQLCAAQNHQVFKELVADCLGSDPDQPCECCTGCCNEEKCQMME